MSEKKPLEIIIIGLGAGGLYASKSALAYNRNCHVTIIEKRDFDQFSPCGLPFVIEGVIKDFDESTIYSDKNLIAGVKQSIKEAKAGKGKILKKG